MIAWVGSLERVMHVPAGGPQLSFDIVESRATRLEIPAPGPFEDKAGCYHFATQLDGTGQNATGWPRRHWCKWPRNH